jgi:hypothetical protein
MPVWSMLEECVSQLDEPFRHSEILGWFRRHHPDVKETTVAAHIYAATSNAANRAKNHPYLGRRPALVRRVDHGLYVRADRSGSGQLAGTPAGARTGPIAAEDEQPRLRVRAADRARSNVEALVTGFASYVSSFQAGNPFSGSSVYFHQKAIERRRSHDSVDALLADQQFLEYVYAVLPAWGMHRMGAQRAKVTEYARLVGSLRATAPSLRKQWPLRRAHSRADLPGRGSCAPAVWTRPGCQPGLDGQLVIDAGPDAPDPCQNGRAAAAPRPTS